VIRHVDSAKEVRFSDRALLLLHARSPDRSLLLDPAKFTAVPLSSAAGSSPSDIPDQLCLHSSATVLKQAASLPWLVERPQPQTLLAL
jgi:hypothetical protein